MEYNQQVEPLENVLNSPMNQDLEVDNLENDVDSSMDQNPG